MPDLKFSELHFLLREELERGGFPAEETWDRLEMRKGEEEEEGCLVSASPVNEEMKEL